MNISIIGTGSFGTALGKALSPKHQITFGSRTPKSKLEWASSIGKDVQVTNIRDAAQKSEVIILALNWFDDTLIKTISTFESLNNKIIIDASNVLQKDFTPLKFEHSNSGAEEILRQFPQAKVVKAFNTASGHTISNGLLKFGNLTTTGFYCGDNEKAKAIAAELLMDAGFTPLDSGPLKNSHHLESLGQFLIALAFQQKKGVDVGWAFLERSLLDKN